MLTTWLVLGLLFIQGCLSMVDVTPRDAIVLPNQNVTFLCRIGQPLQYCRVEIPGIGTFNLNNNVDPTKGVSYYGAGLSAGQCGFTINRVSEAHNGPIACNLGLKTQSEELTGNISLTVARAPKAPELDLSKGTDSLRVYKINDVLHASCLVRDGRPAANISWYLDDERVYDGLSVQTVIDIANQDLYSNVQNLSRQLQASDNGKYLKCIANHPALLGSNAVAMRQLDVKYAPLPLGNPIDRFGYEIGKPGIISVEIEANPKPRLEWTVREQKIREGAVDATGRIEAEIAQELGRGRYAANLRIAAINKQDTETQYILTAYNDMGTQDYTILISTSPEPEGLDLGVGSIIGIVVAILLVVLIVSLVIIARVKGRWCFSETRERPHVAENSDTESAEVRPRETRRTPLSLRLPAMFKKGDKVAEKEGVSRRMETEETKMPLEEEQNRETGAEGKDNREGLVYAELDLVGSNLKPVLKSDDDKTEYAEIVYTNDQQREQPSDDKNKS